MRLVAIENPTPFIGVEEYLLFECEDTINLEQSIGSLSIYTISVKQEYHRADVSNRHLITVEKTTSDFSKQEWEEALQQFLIEEFGHRIDFPDGVIIKNNIRESNCFTF